MQSSDEETNTLKRRERRREYQRSYYWINKFAKSNKDDLDRAQNAIAHRLRILELYYEVKGDSDE